MDSPIYSEPIDHAIRQLGNIFKTVSQVHFNGPANYNIKDLSLNKYAASRAFLEYGETVDVAVTVNINPYKSMNKKRWFTYSHDKQREILCRLEAKFRRDNPTTELIEIHYEICPATTIDDFANVHFHALYNMPKICMSTMQNYYDRTCKASEKWKHLDAQIIRNKAAWLCYIRKDAI